MANVVIRGGGHDTEILLDGVPVRHLSSFALVGDGANKPTRLILNVKVDDVAVETEATIEKVE